MSPSSKPICTFSNSTGAYALSMLAAEVEAKELIAETSASDWTTHALTRHPNPTAAQSGARESKQLVPEIERHFGEKHVRGDDHDVGNDDRLCSRAADSL